MTTRSQGGIIRAHAHLLVFALVEALALLSLRAALTPDPVHAAQAQSASYPWNLPTWAPLPAVPADNPMSEAKVALGRRLFYDKRLSSDGTMSCGSCHEQALAFTDGQQTHFGVTGELGIRNAMTLTNVAYFPTYTWANPSLTTLEKQAQIPLFSDHPVEMGMMGHDPQLIAALEADSGYRKAFRDSFPDEQNAITVRNITRAIAAFERTLLSFDSPYDRYKHGEPEAISDSARRGESLFFGDRLECDHCHGGLNFTDNHMQAGQAFPENGFHNTGLYNEDGLGAYTAKDHGLRDVTARAEDEGAFRTPTLRNIAVTAPYMHDGTFMTLKDVIREHYAVKGHAALGKYGASPLRSQFVEGFTISDRELRDLVAFLNALTDTSFLTNPDFADPSTEANAIHDPAPGPDTSKPHDNASRR